LQQVFFPMQQLWLHRLCVFSVPFFFPICEMWSGCFNNQILTDIRNNTSTYFMHYLCINMHNYSCPIMGIMPLRIDNSCVAIKQQLNYIYVLKMVHSVAFMQRVCVCYILVQLHTRPPCNFTGV
jgi:hypothetical protein